VNQTQKMKARKRRTRAGMPGAVGLNSRRPGGRYRHGVNLEAIRESMRTMRQMAMNTSKPKQLKRLVLAIGTLMGMSNRRGRA